MYYVNKMFDFLFPKVPQVDVSHVKNAIETHEQCIILDVRTKEEYSKGKLEGSSNIPLNELAKRVAKELSDKSAKVYVYCLSGSRSRYAVSEMMEMGYTNVFDMKQGMLAWRAKGFPVF